MGSKGTETNSIPEGIVAKIQTNKVKRVRKRDDKVRAKEREYKKKKFDSMSLEEIMDKRPKDALRKRQYRSNLTLDQLNELRLKDKHRKRTQRAEKRAQQALNDLKEKKKLKKQLQNHNQVTESYNNVNIHELEANPHPIDLSRYLQLDLTVPTEEGEND